ncbi:MAG: LCP family protein [Lactococcus raffinolactis]|jgi:polyisoprenyl-teichoic acid--peptidoglycan teichoic acid transferase|uniref:Regulatory protein MsrR n=1 Tax=Pseudolactococcus raffinolactis TaxID=1366 RepID=A0A5R9CI03_9LACT|nr:LCP family protein [Lactococcus raffinolactis]MBP6300767.1 LCP family protein [Lactococcus sp.]MBR2542326.1 LCP family protein [Lactococcus sp.]MBW9331677.1 LytR family transcriptional regulator [Lactococcus raffinolactis]MDG4960695.1 LCP family protein [Lactococcus raffinolactis]MDN5415234.1 LCP family protein [Lactococcus raffinolactis]
MDQRIKLRIEYLRANLKYLNDVELAEYNRLTGQHLTHQQQHQQHTHQQVQETYQADQAYQSQQAYDQASNFDLQNSSDGFNKHHKSRPFKKPKNKKKRKKVGFWKKLRRFLLLVLVLMIGFFIYGYHRGKSRAPEGLQTEKFSGQKTPSGATNILILGTDQRDFQTTGDARSDSIMVMQVNAKDNKVKLVSFMRDTLVYQPGVSQYGADTKINVAYNIGEQDNHQGAEYMREVLKKNFDIDIQYYALVNFNSFATVIDSLYPMGVKIDAKFSTIDGQVVKSVDVPDDLNWTPEHQDPIQTIKVGTQRMDGRTLLNYARFRKDDEGDFGRTKRQQQVMQAIMSGVKSPLTLFTGSSALGTIKGVTSTNVSDFFMLTHAPGLALDAAKGIESYTVPENGDWVEALDQYGGSGLLIDFDKYQAKLKNLLG